MRAGRQSGHGLILLKNVILVDPLILLTLLTVRRNYPYAMRGASLAPPHLANKKRAKPGERSPPARRAIYGYGQQKRAELLRLLACLLACLAIVRGCLKKSSPFL